MLRCGLWPVLAIIALSHICVATAQDRSPPAEPEGMQALFTGTDLTGWDGDPKLWSVKEGVIRGETTKENPAPGNTFLINQSGEYGDFDLRLSFRLAATNNSGIQYRSRHITEGSPRNAWVVRGYQHELRNELDMPNVSGFIYDEGGKRQRVCLAGERATWTKEGKKQVAETLISAEEFKSLFKIDDWNDTVIRAEGNQIKHYLNGRLILDFTDEGEGALKSGIVALQLHGGAPMWAEFKNIRIKKLKVQ
jgi:hypothetical protein